jgi:hypothetical protein
MVFGEPEQMTKKTVLVTSIAGGLGNQMFTHAAADKLVFAPELNNDLLGKYASWGFDGLLPGSRITLAMS